MPLPHTNQPTGADRLTEALQQAGVTDVFTLCGNHLLPIYRALVDAGVRLVDTRTESSAVMAADGYARAGRRLGVALVTGGPGHTNGLTGLATAYSAGVPVLLLSGASGLDTRGQGAHQELDQVSSARPYAKHAAEATAPGEVAGLVGNTIRAMLAPPAGTGFVSLPLDVMQASAPAGSAPAEPPLGPADPPALDEGGVEKTDALLATALRPVAVLGSGAYWERAEHVIATYCQRMRIPLFTKEVARGAIPEDGFWCFGYPDPTLNPTGGLVAEADVVVLFGTRADYRFRYGATFARAAAVVEVGTDDRPFGARLPGSHVVSGPTVAVTGALTTTVDPEVAEVRRAWLDRHRAMYERWRSALRRAQPDDTGAAGGRLDPEQVALAVRNAVPADATVCLDAGDFVQWCRPVLAANGPGRWLRAGRMATCGSALPLALGAAVAGNAPVIAITGDGSLGYHVSDLETLARNGLPVVCVVGNNSAWGAELSLQNGLYEPEYVVASRLGDVDYVTVARGFGVAAERATSTKDVEDILAEFARRRRPGLIEVPITDRPSPLIQASIARGGSM